MDIKRPSLNLLRLTYRLNSIKLSSRQYPSNSQIRVDMHMVCSFRQIMLIVIDNHLDSKPSWGDFCISLAFMVGRAQLVMIFIRLHTFKPTTKNMETSYFYASFSAKRQHANLNLFSFEFIFLMKCLMEISGYNRLLIVDIHHDLLLPST